MADTELLPCPFCGNKAEVHEEFRSAGHRAIECAECGANVGAVDLDRGIEMWNRRAALASRPAEVDDEGSPAVLFDGHAVYSEITCKLGKAHCHSHETVSATLDAVVRLMRAAPAERAQ